MNIQFWTFGRGHLVSDKEFERLKKGFNKVGMYLYRHDDEKQPEPDLIMVKGFSHEYKNLPRNKPVIYLSIGSEWKLNGSPDLNEPIRELYEKADVVVHISQYCMDSHKKVFPKIHRNWQNEFVIIPAEEPKLPDSYPILTPDTKLKLATTAIPRPVKRIDQLEELCRKYEIELVPAWGGVSDFSYYHNCHGYITIPRKEGMPNNVLEALAYGLPCIVTNYGGSSEAVGEAGVVIKTDPEDVPWDPTNIQPIDEYLFSQAINEFRKNLPELRLKTRERVLSELNDYVTACKFKEVFETICRK